MAAIVGDNCNVNRAFARRLGPLFVGCHNHRYQLAVEDILQTHMLNIESVRAIMRKLSFQILAAKLRRLTPLRAKLDTETR